MISVKNTIKCYDLESTNARKEKEISVCSHWNEQSKVVIELGNGDKITLVADDLMVAIKNATNINRY